MRIMAIDYGDAHTGIAISDPTGFLTGFTTVITAYRPDVAAERVTALAREHGVDELVLGYPRNIGRLHRLARERNGGLCPAPADGFRASSGALG